jgi:amino acid adenylation domain-containing protein
MTMSKSGTVTDNRGHGNVAAPSRNARYTAIMESEQSTASSLLTEDERHRVLIEWNDTAAPYPRESVQQLFEGQVERTPDADAVIFGDERLTYGELNRRANHLAHHLRARGIGPDILVGLCLERSLEMMVGLLGILKAGGAYVPLDPTYPSERLAFMLADSAAPILLTTQTTVAALPAYTGSVLALDTDWAEIATAPDTNPAPLTTPDNLAYVIYTSGSTGTPKGVAIEQRGLVNYLHWAIEAYEVAAGQGAPVHSTIAFDLTITGLFAPLLVGRTTRLLTEDASIEALSTLLRDETNFSLVKITPSHLQLLSRQLPAETVAGRTRMFIIGGENLTAEHIAFWQEYAPDTVLINEYGPTETVVGCCVYRTPLTAHAAGSSIPIGRPIANTQLYILDEEMRPVAIGVPGELYIGGAGVARGYLNRPDLTAERFLPDPFSSVPGARLYKTGDLTRYLPDGTIEYLGRLDQQVRIRGYRIEPGEIVAALNRYPAVHASHVAAREQGTGDKRLVAYVVPAPGEEPTAAALQEFLGISLPDYMVPTTFVRIAALPLTPNGKIDTAALPEPDATNDMRAAATTAEPLTPMQERLAAIVAGVLGVEHVGIDDDFFMMGGHSLLGVQLISRIRDNFGVTLPLLSLFEAPTVAELAVEIERLFMANLEAMSEEDVQRFLA